MPSFTGVASRREAGGSCPRSAAREGRGRLISKDLPVPTALPSRSSGCAHTSVPQTLYTQGVGKGGANALAQETVCRSLSSPKMSDMDPEQRSLRFAWHLACVAHRKPWVGVCVLEEPDREGSFSSCAARGSEHFKEEANLQHLGEPHIKGWFV